MDQDVNIEYKALAEYKVAPEVQRRLDDVQKKIVEQIIIPELMAENEEVIEIIDIVGPLVDDFQDEAEEYASSPEMATRYLQELLRELDSLLAKAYGQNYKEFTENVDKIVDNYIVETELEREVEGINAGFTPLGQGKKVTAIRFLHEHSEDVHTTLPTTADVTDSLVEAVDRTRYMLPEVYGSSFEAVTQSDWESEFLMNTINPILSLFIKMEGSSSMTMEALQKLDQEADIELESLRWTIDAQMSAFGFQREDFSVSIFERMLSAMLQYQQYKVCREIAKIQINDALVAYGEGKDPIKFKESMQLAGEMVEKAHKLRKSAYDNSHIYTGEKFVALSVDETLVGSRDGFADDVYELVSTRALIAEFIASSEQVIQIERDHERLSSISQMDDIFTGGAVSIAGNLLSEEEVSALSEMGIDITGLASSAEDSDIMSLQSSYAALSDGIAATVSQLEEKIGSEVATVDLMGGELEDIYREMRELEDLSERRSIGVIFDTSALQAAEDRRSDIGTPEYDDKDEDIDPPSAAPSDGPISFETFREDIPERKSAVGIGFSSEIHLETVDDFEFIPNAEVGLIPTTVIDSFDSKTGLGHPYNPMNLWPYERNYGEEIAMTLVASTDKQLTRLPIPQGYLVDDSTLKLSTQLPYDIRKDVYGFTYLILDNPENREITFSLGLVKNPFISSISSGTDEQLYEGPYSPEAEELFDEITGRSDDPFSTRGKVEKIKAHIQENFVYALDSKYNSIFDGYENVIQAVEETYVDFEGQKVHPAICNVSALIAVAYLRKVGVKAMVISGYSSYSGNTYARHAWVRYYDEENKTFKEFDPTPSRKVGKLTYIDSETGGAVRSTADNSYERSLRERELSFRIDKLSEEKADRRKSIRVLRDISFKLERDRTMRMHPEFSAQILEADLMERFESWDAELLLLVGNYFEDDTEEKKDALASLKEFVKTSLRSACSAIYQNSQPTTEEKRTFQLVYIEFYIAIIERIKELSPETETDNICSSLQGYYDNVGEVERLYEVVGDIGNAKQLVVINDVMYERDITKGYSGYKRIASLEGVSHTWMMKSKDESRWLVRCGKKDGFLIVTEEGVKTLVHPSDGYFEEPGMSPSGVVYYKETKKEPRKEILHWGDKKLVGIEASYPQGTDFTTFTIDNQLYIEGEKALEGIAIEEIDQLGLYKGKLAIAFLKLDGSVGIYYDGEYVIVSPSTAGYINIHGGRHIEDGVFQFSKNQEGAGPLHYKVDLRNGIAFEVDTAYSYTTTSGPSPIDELMTQLPPHIILRELSPGSGKYALEINGDVKAEGSAYEFKLIGGKMLVRSGRIDRDDMFEERMMKEDGGGLVSYRNSQNIYDIYDVQTGESEGEGISISEDVMYVEEGGHSFVYIMYGDGTIHNKIESEPLKPSEDRFVSAYRHNNDLHVMSLVSWPGEDAKLTVTLFENAYSDGQAKAGRVIYENNDLGPEFVNAAVISGKVQIVEMTRTGGHDYNMRLLIDGVVYADGDMGYGSLREGQDGQLAEGQYGELFLQNESGDQFSSRLDALGSLGMQNYESFAVEAFRLQAEYAKGNELSRKDILFLIKHYCFYGANREFFAFTSEEYRERFPEHLAFYEQRLSDLHSSVSPSDMDITELAYLDKVMPEIRGIRIEDMQGATSQELGGFLEDILYENYSLLFEREVNVFAQVNGTMAILSRAIKEGDLELVREVSELLEGHVIAPEISRRIKNFAFLPNRNAGNVSNEWREIYWKLNPDSRDLRY